MENHLTLGLDLGSNSIGWALIDEQAERIVAAGVRVFPEGVERTQQGTEQSKNLQRRVARGMRRQIARRARRKRILRKALIAAGLLPEVAGLPADDPLRVEWEREQFKNADPLALRSRALRQRLEPHQIGRAFIHVNQRRGFLSNRKMDRARRKESSEMVKEINALAADMGDRTLGEYLDAIRASDPHVRTRGRHTRRDMYIKEFEEIWTAQQKYHPDLLTEKLKYGLEGKQEYPRLPRAVHERKALERYGIYGLLFFQRPMYWPKSVVGRCELEPKLKRCPRADRLAQRFRLLQEVNNLRLLDPTTGEERPLNADERGLLVDYLSRHKERKFSEIRRRLNFLESVRFNLERGDRDKLLGMPTDHALANRALFGKSWNDKLDEEKNHIVELLLNDEIGDHEKVQHAIQKWRLPKEAAERLVDTDLGDGYSSYSRVAIVKLLPFLERGLPMTAPEHQLCALREAGYLQPHERSVRQKDFLPAPPDVTNPLVRRALHEVRKVVNAILREYGKPARIHIELAREIKGTIRQRQQYTNEIRERERARDSAADAIRASGVKVSRDAIDRYLLWEEQNRVCMYSGKSISLTQLLGGEVDVDHILPYSRSLDNSLMNRVVCFRSENDAKANGTPFEWLAEIDPEKFDHVLQRAARPSYPYAKAKKFRQKNIELDEFFARQFVDTTYITTQVREYVQCLGADVVCTKGRHTAELRRQWGLDKVLRHDALKLKNRDDHRHHAVDAVVIALTNRSRLQQLARIHHQGGSEWTGEILAEPWIDLLLDVERAVNAINVSYRVQRRILGSLHKETIFGRTAKTSVSSRERPWARGWVEDRHIFVRRKDIQSIDNTKQLNKVRDSTIREILRQHLRDQQIDPDVPQKVSALVWKKEPRMRSGRPIRRVRMLEQGEGFAEIRSRQCAELSSNHHYEIVELLDDSGNPVCDKDGRPKRKGYLVTMFEAAQRVREAQRELKRLRRQIRNSDSSLNKAQEKYRQEVERVEREHPIIRKHHGRRERFVMSLSINEMVLVRLQDGRSLLHRVQKMSDGILILRPHTYAGKVSDTDKPPIILRSSPTTLRGEKVVVDCLGRIRRAKD
jgi:CRISPR-associated endonuclease Csn1